MKINQLPFFGKTVLRILPGIHLMDNNPGLIR